MANVANSKATGPTSPDAVSGGTTFTPKVKASVGSLGNFTNSSEEARRSIMGLRFPSTGFGTNVEAAMTRKPS